MMMGERERVQIQQTSAMYDADEGTVYKHEVIMTSSELQSRHHEEKRCTGRGS